MPKMSDSDPNGAGGDLQTGLAPALRLKAIWDYAMRRHDPSTQVDWFGWTERAHADSRPRSASQANPALSA